MIQLNGLIVNKNTLIYLKDNIIFYPRFYILVELPIHLLNRNAIILPAHHRRRRRKQKKKIDPNKNCEKINNWRRGSIDSAKARSLPHH